MLEEAKHPAFLYKQHRIAHLNRHHVHQETGHGGRNHVLAGLRLWYWIPRASCSKNHDLRVQPLQKTACKGRRTKMADLPKDHLLPDKSHFRFTNTGVDYFGPFEIRRGCRSPKLWCALHLPDSESRACRSCPFP